MIFRLALTLFAIPVCALVLSCSDDDNGSEPQASQAALCEGWDTVQGDVDNLQAAVQDGDRAAAEAAVDDVRTDLVELRDDVRSSSPSSAASQSAADLVGAVEGMETTLRQAGQGGGSIQGVVQELEIALGAIASSLESLASELRCD